MLDFTFCAPTKVVFGRGAVDKIGSELAALGARKVLILYGSGRVKHIGLIGRICQLLTEHNISWCELSGVVPNPRMALAKQGVALCRKEGVDLLLAVGGGSVIDTAKAIGYGLANDFDLVDLYMGRVQAKDCMRLATVSTIAAAGSETSDSSVITIEEGGYKKGHNNAVSRPKVAFMDPELTFSTPAYQTASGAADIMMHTMERYFTTTPDVTLIDRMSCGLLSAVQEAAVVAVKEPDNYAARATLLWASSISHNGLLGTGRVIDFASHRIEHELGGLYDVAHGAGLCAVWGSWARYTMHVDETRFAGFGQQVFGVPPCKTVHESALAGIMAWEDWCRRIGMPVNLKELGVFPSDEDICLMADKGTDFDQKRLGGFLPLGREDVRRILEMARG